MTCLKSVVLLCFFLLSSCAVGPDYKRPVAPLPKADASKPLSMTTVSTQTSLGKAQRLIANKTIPAQWWELFHSKPLNNLVIASLKHNPSIHAAEAALHGALEQVYAQQGGFFPLVALSFSPTKQKTARILTSVLSSNRYDYSLYTGQVFVSYTPDVFGGLRRQVESLTAQAEFQRLQLEATYLTIASNVVNAAIQEAALHDQILATKNMIAAQRRLVEITQKQHQLGDAALTDLVLQKASLAATKATLPPLEKQLALQQNLLNALSGRFPDDKRTPPFELNSLHLPTELPLSLPSALIEQRPDIRAAEEQMHAANALIGVAVSNRLPNVTLGFTNAGTAATSLSHLFQPNTIFWGLAGLIAQPIFDGGTLLHRQRFAETFHEKSAAQYRLTVINAFQNVSDTLNAIRLDAIALQTANSAEQMARTNVTIVRRQWAAGDINKGAWWVAEQTYQQSKLNLIQAKANRLSDTVALFQALGGGWWEREAA